MSAIECNALPPLLAELRHTRTLNSSGFLCCAVSPRRNHFYSSPCVLRSKREVRASSVAIDVRCTSITVDSSSYETLCAWYFVRSDWLQPAQARLVAASSSVRGRVL